ncbi:hypothetical protein KCU86_g18401, partial [Aureobasidium melanogenum]
MVLARVAEYLSPSDTISHHAPTETAAQRDHKGKIVQQESAMEEEDRPPYVHAMLAGGLGGLMGDMLMHSLDTVKTRQQGDP